MNSFLNKLERRFGRYAISNLAKYLVYGYGVGYALYFLGMIFKLNLLILTRYCTDRCGGLSHG